MNSQDIRDMIERAIAQEGPRSPLEAALAQIVPDAAQRQQTSAFVSAYVRETPELMDALWTAADSAGVLPNLGPMFDAAFQYWQNPLDMVPDHLGLLGLIDDAYFTHRFLQLASERHQAQTGNPLLPGDLTQVNTQAGILLGPAIQQALDQRVEQHLQGPGMQNVLEHLLAAAGPGGIGFGGFGGYGMPDRSFGGVSAGEFADTMLGSVGVV